MIDLLELSKYTENNRIEAKLALGGLPQSIWETYSAFANTMGGVILLGVTEYSDKSLHPVDLPNRDNLIKEFFSELENPNRVSKNVLVEQDVKKVEVEGKRIVMITVPKAVGSDKPVYVNGVIYGGTYRRNGEGDYRCTRDEVDFMVVDARRKTRDMGVLKGLSSRAINFESVKKFRSYLKELGCSKRLEKLTNKDFLVKIGALTKGKRVLRPTGAGLIMFGKYDYIKNSLPNFSLKYLSHAFSSQKDSLTFLGNAFDFFGFIFGELKSTLKLHGLENERQIVRGVVEALANCIVNADYYQQNSVIISNQKDTLYFINSGSFRIDVETAKRGGVSDPRNSALVKMFNLISVGKGEGSGISSIYSAWQKYQLPAPIIKEDFSPDKISFVLSLTNCQAGEGLNDTPKETVKLVAKQAVIEYLTQNVTATTKELKNLLNVSYEILRECLDELIADQTIIAEGVSYTAPYRLKR